MKQEERVEVRAKSWLELRCHALTLRVIRSTSGWLLPVVLLLGVLPQVASGMQPGWTRGCSKPVYGSADAACASLLEIPGSFFVVDFAHNSCNIFNSAGTQISSQSICMDCPTGTQVNAGRCVSNPGGSTDVFANAGSQLQPPLSADKATPDAAEDPIMVGSPVNARTGNKYQREVDYSGHGAFPLIFARHYNSQFVYQSQLGISWRHSYDRQLIIEDATHIIVVRPNGQAFQFVLAAGQWSSAIDLVDRLHATTSGFTLTTQSDEVETYDTSGRLLTITNRAGLTQTLTYSTGISSAAPRAGLLVSVTDALGHQLKFTYDLRSLLKTMTDPAGNVFQFAYNRTGILTSVTYPGASAAVKTYIYGTTQLLANSLAGIRDENGQPFATFTYDVGTAQLTGANFGGTLVCCPINS